jgi:L-amino acid N-acyltransferase YncA
MIRLATEGDARDIADIYNENREEQGFANCDLGRDDEETRARALASSHPRHPTFVNLGGGSQVLGWSQLKPLSARPSWHAVAEIALYVTRSSRAGLVGAQLLVQLLDAARARGYGSLVAIVLARNTASLRGLAFAGFFECARLRDAAHLYSQWIDIVWVQKDLGKPDDPSIANHIRRFRADAIDPMDPMDRRVAEG